MLQQTHLLRLGIAYIPFAQSAFSCPLYRRSPIIRGLCKFLVRRQKELIYLLGNKSPSLGWGYVGWLCQPNGSAWHSSPVRIYSYAASGPPCGLLEQKDVDSIRALQCRPRLGPRHGAEGFLSERYVLSKSPIPSPPISMQWWNTPMGC